MGLTPRARDAKIYSFKLRYRRIRDTWSYRIILLHGKMEVHRG